jgi:hypothetical protein
MPNALPNNGFWYQPASLWSIAYVDAAADVASLRFNFRREHFRNPTRHPITINRFALSGVNYPVDIMNVSTAAPGTDAVSVANSAMLNLARIKISAPYRKGYSRTEIPLASYSPRATGWISGSTLSDSSLFGVNYLKFDKNILLPRKGALEVSLSGTTRITTDYFGLGNNIFFGGADSAAPRPGRFFFHEVGGLFSGSARQKGLSVVTTANIVPIPDPYSGIPFGLPANYGFPVEAGALPVALWPPQSQMNARDFEQQESTRSGSSEVYGMGIFIDQIDYDDDSKAQFLALQGVSPGREYKLGMTASSVGCRARAMHAPGSNDWWWRPGAPVCLVLDTITDALVYDLPDPITLSMGETLDVTMVVPAASTVNAAANYQIGISFNGWTAVEG